MKKSTSLNEKQFLELLKKVLPQAVQDNSVAGRIIEAMEKEIHQRSRVSAFSDFCEGYALPNLEKMAVGELQQQFGEFFGKENIHFEVDEDKNGVQVQLKLGDTELSSFIKVDPEKAAEEEEVFTPKFVAWPVSLPTDPELVWMLGKHETLSPDEAAVFLAQVEEEFWASKTGQKLLRKRVERSFPEFIARVPSKMLTEKGLRRHYKEPEAVKVLHPVELPKNKKGATPDLAEELEEQKPAKSKPEDKAA